MEIKELRIPKAIKLVIQGAEAKLKILVEENV